MLRLQGRRDWLARGHRHHAWHGLSALCGRGPHAAHDRGRSWFRRQKGRRRDPGALSARCQAILVQGGRRETESLGHADTTGWRTNCRKRDTEGLGQLALPKMVADITAGDAQGPSPDIVSRMTVDRFEIAKPKGDALDGRHGEQRADRDRVRTLQRQGAGEHQKLQNPFKELYSLS